MKKASKKNGCLRILSALLVLLGFSACGEEEVFVEYGTPCTKFKVKGTVTNTEGALLKGIQVIVEQGIDLPEQNDTVYTDEQGQFISSDLETVLIDDRMQAHFKDVDGEENGGNFKPVSVSLAEMEKTQVEEGSGWYRGGFELSVQVKMEKQEENASDAESPNPDNR